MIGWADIKRMAANVNSKGDNFSLPGRIINILALLGGVLGFAVFFSYSCYFIKERFQVPVWDGIAVLHFLFGNQETGHTPNLFLGEAFRVRDNEHRPIFPMFLWQFDYFMFKSTGLFPVLVSHILAALTAVIALSGIIRRVAWPIGFLIAGAGLALTFAPMNYENLMWEKQVHVYMSLFFSTLSLWLAATKVGGSDLRQDAVWLLLIGIFSFVASFSFGYGMVVWPVLIGHALLSRWRLPLTGTIVVFFLLTTALYATTWMSLSHHDNPADTIFHPWGVLKYTAAFLFAPFIRIAGLLVGTDWHQIAIAGGLCLLAIFIFGAVRRYLILEPENSRARFSVMVGTFCIGIGFITALGRLNINTGDSSRYFIVAILFLLALPGMIWSGRVNESTLRNAFLVSFFYLLIGTAVSSQFTYRNDIEKITMDTIEGALAAEFKVSDTVRGLYPNKIIIDEQVWPYYRRRQNEIGRKLPYSWIGKPFAEIFDTYSSCPGQVEALKPVAGHPGIYTIRGWARFGNFGQQPADWVVAVDQNAIIAGLARVAAATPALGKQLFDLYPDHVQRQSERSGLVGYVRAGSETTLDFYAIHDKEICRFESGLAVERTGS